MIHTNIVRTKTENIEEFSLLFELEKNLIIFRAAEITLP